MGYWRKDKRGIEVTGRRGRRRRKLLNDHKERRGYSHLKEKALDRSMWRARFGRGFGSVVRQTNKWMNEKKEHQLHNLQAAEIKFLSRMKFLIRNKKRILKCSS